MKTSEAKESEVNKFAEQLCRYCATKQKYASTAWFTCFFCPYTSAPYCFLHCFPSFRVQNLEHGGDNHSTFPHSNNARLKIEIQGCRHNFCLTVTTVNSICKVALCVKFTPSNICQLERPPFLLARVQFLLASVQYYSQSTHIRRVPIFNHYRSTGL